MCGRSLAAVNELIGIISSDSILATDRIETWARNREFDVRVVEAGDEVTINSNRRLNLLGVTIGDDDTFLEGVKQFAPSKIPLLGINTGTQSFLPRIQPPDLTDALEEVIQGQATVDSCFQYHVQTPSLDVTGITEVVIENPSLQTSTERKITTLDVFINGEFVGEYNGTGLAVATPTGAMGRSLSAGGPVHDPRNNATLQIVPLQAQTEGVRPLVVGQQTKIEIVARQPAHVQVDGGREQRQL
jgi:myo-inositol-1(or 4)-monophosphatase